MFSNSETPLSGTGHTCDKHLSWVGIFRGLILTLLFMHEPVTIDELRKTFRDAYERYVEEGWRMRDLLIQVDSTEETQRKRAIAEQQRLLDEALRDYEQARSAYVTNVLGSFAGAGGAQF